MYDLGILTLNIFKDFKDLKILGLARGGWWVGSYGFQRFSGFFFAFPGRFKGGTHFLRHACIILTLNIKDFNDFKDFKDFKDFRALRICSAIRVFKYFTFLGRFTHGSDFRTNAVGVKTPI